MEEQTSPFAFVVKDYTLDIEGIDPSNKEHVAYFNAALAAIDTVVQYGLVAFNSDILTEEVEHGLASVGFRLGFDIRKESEDGGEIYVAEFKRDQSENFEAFFLKCFCIYAFYSVGEPVEDSENEDGSV